MLNNSFDSTNEDSVASLNYNQYSHNIIPPLGFANRDQYNIIGTSISLMDREDTKCPVPVRIYLLFNKTGVAELFSKKESHQELEQKTMWLYDGNIYFSMNNIIDSKPLRFNGTVEELEKVEGSKQSYKDRWQDRWQDRWLSLGFRNMQSRLIFHQIRRKRVPNFLILEENTSIEDEIKEINLYFHVSKERILKASKEEIKKAYESMRAKKTKSYDEAVIYIQLCREIQKIFNQAMQKSEDAWQTKIKDINKLDRMFPIILEEYQGNEDEIIGDEKDLRFSMMFQKQKQKPNQDWPSIIDEMTNHELKLDWRKLNGKDYEQLVVVLNRIQGPPRKKDI